MTTPAWTLKAQADGYLTVDPLPTAEELRDFYAEQYYQQSKTPAYSTSYSDQELAYKGLLARLYLHALGDGRGRFLEVGCGEGFLLAEVERAGWEVAGIDYSAWGLERFHPQLLPRVAVGDAEAILAQLGADGRRFDVCALQNVLEHVIDPRVVLDALAPLMAPGGRILVTLPNDFSAIQMAALAGGTVSKEYWVCPPQHLHYFNIDTCTSFLEGQGWQIIDAFSDFPIEYYLFHPGSNFIGAPEAGKAAHRARMTLSLLTAERGLDSYLALCRAQACCGIGRAFTLIATPQGIRT